MSNNSLLTDNEFVNKVKQNINEVITEYEYDSDMDLDPHIKRTFRIYNKSKNGQNNKYFMSQYN
jgi:hypothetical protein